MQNRKYYLIFALIISSLVIVGCEDEDDEKVFGAQKCFNEIDDSLAGGPSAASAAQVCLDKLGNVNNLDANLLRCGIYLWIGGTNNTRIFNAYDAYDAAPANQKELTLMSALALTNAPNELSTADTAYGYCEDTGAAGLIYVTGLIRLGTSMATAVPGAGSVADLVEDCLGTACESAENGEILLNMGDLYCVGDAAQDDVCVALNTARQANGDDPLGTLQTFLSQINF